MMYSGGKSRLARQISPYFIDDLSRVDGVWVEPFVGGFNMVPALAEHISKGYCSDIHRGLPVLYRALRDGWIPPDSVSEELYRKLRARNDMKDPLSVFASFGCSFGGKEWGGYARDRTGKRDLTSEGSRAIVRKSSFMHMCKFRRCNYTNVKVRPSVIYCDPPYKGATGYRTGMFLHEKFYRWRERMASMPDVFVYVSEFNAPTHWDCVWSKPRKTTTHTCQGKYRIEHLFKVKCN